MNPPFTRDSLRHDQFTREEELAIKEREKRILGDDVDVPWYHRIGSTDLKRRCGPALHGSCRGPFCLAGLTTSLKDRNPGSLA